MATPNFNSVELAGSVWEMVYFNFMVEIILITPIFTVEVNNEG